MFSRRLLSSSAPAALVAAFLVSACSDAGTNPQLDEVFSADQAVMNATPDGDHGHVMPGRTQLERLKAAGGKSGGGTGIFYHGGPVLQSGTNVAAVYWASAPIYVNGPAAGSGPGSADASLIGHFLRSLGGSPYFNINHSYTSGTGALIANSVVYTQYWANNSSVPADGANVTDAQMIGMLQSGFTSGALTYDASTVYSIFTANKVNLGGGFGTQYCAYHSHGTVTVGGVSKIVLYAAMPYDYAYPAACTSGLPAANGALDPGADYEVSVLAHEIEETTTDMLGNAWFDRRGYENADKCAWTWGTTYTTAAGGTANMNLGGKHFLVQRNWVNAGTGGCVLAY